jgi:hypothetical protein
LKNGHKLPNSINKDGCTNKASKTFSALHNRHETILDREIPPKDDSLGTVGVEVEEDKIEDKGEIPETPPPTTQTQWIPAQGLYEKQL